MCKIVSEIESPRSADIDIHIYQRRIQELRRQAIFDNFYILNRIENERFTQLRSSQMDTNEQGDIIESVRLLYI
jgi:SHS2 domain-containing protein